MGSEKMDMNDIYRSLAPTSAFENGKEDFYLETLQWALKRDDIYNIALTGPLGSGKSSILCRLKNALVSDKKGDTVLNISLAAFDLSVRQDPEKTCDTNTIARGILEQLFYHEESKKLPFSRFKKLPRWTFKQFTAVVTAICLLAIATLIFVLPNNLAQAISHWQTLTALGIPTWILGIVLTLAAAGIIGAIDLVAWWIVKRCHGFKISFKGGTDSGLTFETDSEENTFDKYLDEILYFFEVTSYDIVIFEDIERFQNTEIFVQLRKLNDLLRRDKNIVRHIRFIYAVKDDIFSNGDAEERTKFFDFIIPVVPVISNINSKEKLKSFLNQDPWKGVGISDAFIEDISSKIFSMRCLVSIMNEFALYHEVLFNSHLDPEKLLSLIVYKNLRPGEFEKLQGRAGILATFLSGEGKEFLRSTLGDDLDAEIKEIEDSIQYEHVQSVHELSKLFFLESGLIQNQNYGSYSVIFEEDSEERTITFKEFFDQCDIPYTSITKTQQGNNNAKALSKIAKDNAEEFEKRRLNILSGTDELKQKVVKLELLKSRRDAMSAKQILDKIEIPESGTSFKGVTLEQGSLEYFMLRRGYIDESYPNYISYFYNEMLSATDNDYVVTVKAYKSLAPEYHLENIEKVIHALDVQDFATNAFLNNELTLFILMNEHAADANYGRKREIALDTLFNESKESKSYLYKLWLSTEDDDDRRQRLIASLTKEWSGFWKYICGYTSLTIEIRKEIIVEMFQWASPEAIITQSPVSLMKEFLEEMSDFTVAMKDAPLETVKCVLEALDICFDKLDAPAPDEKLEYIFKANRYVINPDNVALALRLFGNVNPADIERRNYTAIIENDSLSWFKEQIQEALPDYIDNVLLGLPDDEDESEEAIADICFSELVSEEQKKEVIRKEATIISDISNIPDDLWDYLIAENKLEPSADNVINYYQAKKYTVALRGLLNSKSADIIGSFNCHSGDDEDWKALICAMAYQKETPVELFREYFEILRDELIDVITIPQVQPIDKLSYLINEKAYTLTTENFSELKKRKQSSCAMHIKLLEAWPEEYGDKMTSYAIDNADWEQYLRSTIPAAHKLKYMSSKITQGTKISVDIADALADVIISYNGSDKIAQNVYDKVLTTLTNTNTKMAVVSAVIKINDLPEAQIKTVLTTAGLNSLLTEKVDQEDELSAEKRGLLRCLQEKGLRKV